MDDFMGKQWWLCDLHLLTLFLFEGSAKYNIKQQFIDECHQFLIDCQYRHQWSQIQNLIVNDTWQLIHLTAILPIILEETWMTLVGINLGRMTIL